MNIIDKIKFWSWNKKEEAYERKMKEKYPQWNPENWLFRRGNRSKINPII